MCIVDSELRRASYTADFAGVCNKGSLVRILLCNVRVTIEYGIVVEALGLGCNLVWQVCKVNLATVDAELCLVPVMPCLRVLPR